MFARNIVVRRRAQPAAPVVPTLPGQLLLLRPDLVRRLPPTAVVRDHRGGETQLHDLVPDHCKRVRRCPDPDGSLQWPFSPSAPAWTHVVVRGDTLAGIANQYYGNRERWPEIAERNAITDPRSLQVGQRLVVP